MAKLTLLKDQPIGENGCKRLDGLGFEAYAESLKDSILNTEGPFTIGIFGEWGTGKTSLMRLVSDKLNESAASDVIVPVWFNAWKYEKEAHPIIPLVACIIREVRKHRSFSNEHNTAFKSLLKNLCGLAKCATVNVSAKVPLLAEASIKLDPGKFIRKKDPLEELLDKCVYNTVFDELTALEDQKVKIVIIIDDLDRCFPDKAIALLETIKLILSQPGFIFIFGVSRSVIEGYLNHRYSEKFGLQDFNGSKYLDKIVQLPFPIPPNRDKERIKEFTSNLLQEIDEEYKVVLESISPILGPVCSNNPRAIIRFINNLLICNNIRNQSAKRPEEKIPIGYFAVSQILQQRWEKLFGTLYKNPAFCQEIAQWKKEDLTNKYKTLAEDQSDQEAKSKAEVVNALIGDADLKLLLIETAIGNNWLSDEGLRKKATEFLKSLIVTENDLKIVHSCWRDAKYDERFKREMYHFHAIIQAEDNILDLVEYVTYDLSSGGQGYSDPIRVCKDRESRFKLKELVWGHFNLRAEVKIKNQDETIRLEHLITLSESGPTI